MNDKNPGGMDLSKKPANADNSQQAQEIDFGLNCLVTLQAIAGALEGIAIELSDIKDNSNRKLLHQNLITEDEIIKREEKAKKKPEPRGKPVSKMEDVPEILEDIAECLDGVAVEVSDMKDNSNRQLISEKLLTPADIEERENDDDDGQD